MGDNLKDAFKNSEAPVVIFKDNRKSKRMSQRFSFIRKKESII